MKCAVDVCDTVVVFFETIKNGNEQCYCFERERKREGGRELKGWMWCYCGIIVVDIEDMLSLRYGGKMVGIDIKEEKRGVLTKLNEILEKIERVY